MARSDAEGEESMRGRLYLLGAIREQDMASVLLDGHNNVGRSVKRFLRSWLDRCQYPGGSMAGGGADFCRAGVAVSWQENAHTPAGPQGSCAGS